MCCFDCKLNVFDLQKHNAGKPTSDIFVDLENFVHMPRLVEFMRKRCFAEIPKEILQWAEVRSFRYVCFFFLI